MEQGPPPEDGFGKRGRPAIPIVVMIVSILVAVGAVSVLLFVLFNKTTGPGQVLRHYYQAVAADDCGKAYGLLDDDLKRAIDKDAFCNAVHGVQGKVPTSVSILTVTGCGEPPADFARVTIQEHGPGAPPNPVSWEMARQGSAWQVAAFPPLRRLVGSHPPPGRPRVP